MSEVDKLLDLFDSESGIYPLQITHTSPGPDGYAGVHFADTASVLSLSLYNPEPIKIFAIGKTPVKFQSFEIWRWCDGAAVGDLETLSQLWSPLLYQNPDFLPFEQIGLRCICQRTACQSLTLARSHMETLLYLEKIPTEDINTDTAIMEVRYVYSRIAAASKMALGLPPSGLEPDYTYLKDLEETDLYEILCNFSSNTPTSVFEHLKNFMQKVEKDIENKGLYPYPRDREIRDLNEELLRLRRALF